MKSRFFQLTFTKEIVIISIYIGAVSLRFKRKENIAMKKISSILLALTMLVALCIPAFAGTSIQALTQKGAKEIATSIDTYVKENSAENAEWATALLGDASFRQDMYKEAVLKSITMDDFAKAAYRNEAVELAVNAVKADYAVGEKTATAMKAELKTFLEDEYVGMVPFEKDQIKDVIADNFAPNDVDALFDTLRGTITDLSGRVSGIFRGEIPGVDGSLGDIGEIGGQIGQMGGQDSNTQDETSKEPGEQPEAGMKDPTGDTMIFSMLGLTAVAGATLLLTKKKAKASK